MFSAAFRPQPPLPGLFCLSKCLCGVFGGLLRCFTSYNSCCSLRSRPSIRVTAPCRTSGSGKGFSRAKKAQFGAGGAGERLKIELKSSQALPELLFLRAQNLRTTPRDLQGLRQLQKHKEPRETCSPPRSCCFNFLRAFHGFIFLLPERIHSQWLEIGVSPKARFATGFWILPGSGNSFPDF